MSLLSFRLLSLLVGDLSRIFLNPSLEKRGKGRFYGYPAACRLSDNRHPELVSGSPVP